MGIHLFRKHIRSYLGKISIKEGDWRLTSSPTILTEFYKTENENLNKGICDLTKTKVSCVIMFHSV